MLDLMTESTAINKFPSDLLKVWFPSEGQAHQTLLLSYISQILKQMYAVTGRQTMATFSVASEKSSLTI